MLRSIQFLQDETDESLDLFENTGTCTKYKKKVAPDNTGHFRAS